MVAIRSSNAAPIALALKVIGSILLAIALIDYLVLLFPLDLAEPQWRFQLTAQVVDRGVLPLLGAALLSLSIWVEQVSGLSEKGTIKPLLMGASAALALLFFVMGPMHFIDAGKASATATRQVNDQTEQAEAQLETRLQQERAQINAVISDPSQLQNLDQQLASKDLPADAKERLTVIKENLTRFQADPKLLEAQQESTRNRALSTIRAKGLEENNRVALEFRKSRLRIPLGSLMLAGTFVFIFWTGFTQAR
jgi:cell division protein FtsB